MNELSSSAKTVGGFSRNFFVSKQWATDHR
jgi:hypothetical protein